MHSRGARHYVAAGAGMPSVSAPAPPSTTMDHGAVVPAPMTASAIAPGWFADPARRHQWRYWNGTAWTEHVSDDGVAGSDPS